MGRPVGRRHGEPLYWVVGARHGGGRVVPRSCAGRDKAEALAALFREHLVDYTTITAERAEGRLAVGDERGEMD